MQQALTWFEAATLLSNPRHCLELEMRVSNRNVCVKSVLAQWERAKPSSRARFGS